MQIPLLLINQVESGSLKQSHLLLVIQLKFLKHFISKFAGTLLVNGPLPPPPFLATNEAKENDSKINQRSVSPF